MSDFPFSISFCFYSVFVQPKPYTLWVQNIIPLKIKTVEETQTFLFPDLWFLSCGKKFRNLMMSMRVGAPKNWPEEEFFKLRKSKFWERQFFLMVRFK